MCSMVLVSVVIIVVETFTNRQHGGMGSLIWLRFVMFGIVGYVRGYCWCAHHLLMSLLVGSCWLLTHCSIPNLCVATYA